MNRFKRTYITILMFGTLMLTGCGSDIAIKAQQDGSTDISLNLDIGQSVGGLIKALYGMSGASGDMSLVNTEELNTSLTQNGYSKVKSESTDTKISIDANMPSLTSSAFIQRKKNSLTVAFFTNAIQEEYDAMPETAKAYIDLLMAPVFTGEEISKKEYLELISGAYGYDLANELKTASIKLSLSSPKGTKLKSHTVYYVESQNANTQVYRIPLIDFLVPGKDAESIEAAEISISWE